MSEREIGYVCRRGHYVFDGEDEYGYCGTKRIAGIYVRKDDAVEFYPPGSDDMGTWSGYSEADYSDDLDQAQAQIVRVKAEWERG